VGLRLTPVNWHLSAGEIAYNPQRLRSQGPGCRDALRHDPAGERESRHLKLKLSVAGQAKDLFPYEKTILRWRIKDIEDPELGSQMLYTSGTTGRPKGVFGRAAATPPQFEGSNAQYNPDTDVQLCVGPGYHAAPLAFDIAIPQASGVPIVFIGERWDTEEVFRTIESTASPTRTWCRSCSSACWRPLQNSRRSTISQA